MKTMTKLFWPLLVVYSRILGLILDEEQHILFTMIQLYPTRRQRSKSELLVRTALYFWHQIKSLWSKFFTNFTFFNIVKCWVQREKLPAGRIFDALRSDMHLTPGQFSFSRLLNPDRSSQISSTLPACQI